MVCFFRAVKPFILVSTSWCCLFHPISHGCVICCGQTLVTGPLLSLSLVDYLAGLETHCLKGLLLRYSGMITALLSSVVSALKGLNMGCFCCYVHPCHCGHQAQRASSSLRKYGSATCRAFSHYTVLPILSQASNPTMFAAQTIFLIPETGIRTSTAVCVQHS